MVGSVYNYIVFTDDDTAKKNARTEISYQLKHTFARTYFESEYFKIQ